MRLGAEVPFIAPRSTDTEVAEALASVIVDAVTKPTLSAEIATAIASIQMAVVRLNETIAAVVPLIDALARKEISVDAPDVNVQVPEVTPVVNVEPRVELVQRRVKKTVVRDPQGRIDHVIEEPI